MSQGLCLIGLGPHSKRIYYAYIAEEVKIDSVDFLVLVELESKRSDVEEFFSDKTIKPKGIVFISDSQQISPSKIDKKVGAVLLGYIQRGELKKAIVATEPKAHRIYIDFFLKNRIPTLTDKPLTAPVGANHKKSAARRIYTDALELARLSKKFNTPLYVQVQRREHPAYVFMYKTIQKIIDEHKVPVTFFEIMHSDGTWSMPDEFTTRENHPYKYGYGKLLHSGYHFVDIVARLAELNKALFPKLSVLNRTNVLTPQMQYKQLNGKSLYQKLFNIKTTQPQKSKLGEVDTYTTFVFRDNKSKTDVTYGNLDLLQSGFSKRAWFELQHDTYKGNGRVRHEYINIHMGPLCNIQLHSYQSDQIGKNLSSGVGSEDHLDLYVFRNNEIIGGNPVEKIDFGSKDIKPRTYLGQNEAARHTIFMQFLNNEKSNALIEEQMLTNNIIASMYLSSINNRIGRAI